MNNNKKEAVKSFSRLTCTHCRKYSCDILQAPGNGIILVSVVVVSVVVALLRFRDEPVFIESYRWAASKE